MAENDKTDRLNDEISLLESMYPDQITNNTKSQEVHYTTAKSKIELRLPDQYLVSALPEVLSATINKVDQRDQVKTFIEQNCVPGEEILDSIILYINELEAAATSTTGPEETSVNADDAAKATVIVYLHHLLNTNKRKQCLAPSSASVSGITKPGYPGVLVYTGPKREVWAHVNELKGLNWQAFQVRYEGEERWMFAHGEGVKEVESMGDVVKGLGEDGERKEIFMEAMRMKG